MNGGGVNWRRVAMIAGVVIVLALALWFVTRIPKTVTIFITAAFLASAVHPIVNLLEARRMARSLAIASVFFVLVLVVAIFLGIVLPMVALQAQSLLANIPTVLQTVQSWAIDFRTAIQHRFPSFVLPPQAFNIQQFGAERMAGILTTGLASLGTFALNVATALFIAISALVLSFFMLLNHRQLAEGFASIFPTRRRQTALRLAAQVVHVFGSFIAGQAIVSAITGVLIAGISAIFGFKFALLLGLISAIAYAVPIVGMLAVHVLALVLAAPQGPVMIVTVEAIVFAIARVSDSVFVPKIMGNSVGVSPIGVMFAVFAGGELFGLPGLILGIPAAALIKLVWGYFIGPWLHAQIEFADLSPPPPPPVPEVAVIVTDA